MRRERITSQEFVDKVFANSIRRGGLTPPRKVVYGEQVSEHLKVGIDHLTSPDTGEITLLPQTVTLFEKARGILGQPVRARRM
jgi:hypothetical protein